MSKYSINGTTLDNIAAPIMSMRGLTGGLTPEEMGTNANAVLANVTDALTAIAAKGVDITGMNSDNLAALIEALATLPALTTPGAAADLRTGKQLIDGSGKIVTGTMPEQAAQTITPGTSNKTIASGRYLTGTQTIKGDSNLVAANIASGKTIFGVAGSYTGGGKFARGEFTMDTYEVEHTITHGLGAVPNLTIAMMASQNVGNSGGLICDVYFKGVRYSVIQAGSNWTKVEFSNTPITYSTNGMGSATTSTVKYFASAMYYPCDITYIIGVV